MRRAVTAIYRSYATATLVRDELERSGIARRHVTIIPDDERGSTGATGATSAAGYAAMTPRYADTVPAYADADQPYGDAFDDLHDLHLPEEDTRIYQQAIRNGDYVVSVDVDDDADIARIQEIMRRPEEAYDLDELDTRYGDAAFAPRRRPLDERYQAGMTGRRVEDQRSTRTRRYDRDLPVWPRGDGV